MNGRDPSTITRTHGGTEGEPDEVPERIGRYEVIERIGAGGMGVVFAALDPELDRAVAIKLVRPRAGRDREAAQQRLRREAQALARLANPNVVSIHDLVIEPERIGVVMQYVEGVSPYRWLATPRRRTQILACFVGAGRGLAAAHAAGIVHRDFKPSNVLVDESGTARVTDFGIALVVETGEDHDAATTGQVIGTPQYMAPEQFLAKDITPATDQFGFCVSLWEALAGERPFAGTTSAELHQQTLAHAIRTPPPGRIPRGLQRVLRRGLAVAPAERFPDMETLLELIAPRRRTLWLAAAAGVAGVTAITATVLLTTADAPSCAVDTQQIDAVWSVSRHDQLAASLGAVRYPRGEDLARRTIAVLDERAKSWRDGALAACEAEASRGAGDPVAVARRGCLERSAADLDAAITELAAIRTAPALIHALAIARGGRAPATCSDPRVPAGPTKIAPAALRDRVAAIEVAWWAGRIRQVVDDGTTLAPEVDGSGDVTLQQDFWRVQAAASSTMDTKRMRDTSRRAAEAASAAGDDLAAVHAWTKAASIAADAEELEVVDDLLAMARASASRARSVAGDQAIAITEGDVAIAKRDYATAIAKCGPISEDASRGVDDLRQRAFSCLTTALDHARRWRELEVATTKMLAELAPFVGREHPRVVVVLTALASARFMLGDRDGARAIWREVEAAFVTAHGPESIAQMMLSNNIATFEGEYDRGEVTPRQVEAMTRAMTIARTLLPVEDSRRGRIAWSFANMKNNANDPDTATAAYREAMRAFSADKNPEVWAMLAVTVGGVDLDHDRCHLVLPLVDRVLTLHGVGKVSISVAGTAHSLRGQCYAKAGKLDQFSAEMAASIALLEKQDDVVVTLNAELNAADLELAHGRKAAARRLAQSARNRLKGSSHVEQELEKRIAAILD